MMERTLTRERNGGLRRSWKRLWRSPLPTIGCEISPSGVSLARWSARPSQLDTAAWRPLPAGAIDASPLRENIAQPEAVREALAGALRSVGIGSAAESDAVLILPDQAARLFVLGFDALPSRGAEALSVVKWRLKKSVPFDIDSAAISYTAQRVGGQWQVLAAAAPQDSIRQYEALVEGFGLRPRWVTLSTLAMLGLVRTFRSREPAAAYSGSERRAAQANSGTPAVLVAKYSPPWLTTAILQGEFLRLFRTVGLAAGEDDLLTTAQLLEALFPSVSYFQDNFAGTLVQACLCGLGANSAALAEAVESELHLRTEPAMPASGVLLAGRDPWQTEQQFAALLGIVWGQRLG